MAALPLFVLFVFISMLGYKYIQPEYSWLESLYMTVITIGTVGYREIHPPTAAGQLWTVFVITGGLIMGAVLLSLVASIFVEGQIRRILGRRQLDRKIDKLSGHIIVCGYGRMGELVAEDLVAAGKEVVIIDTDSERTSAAERAGLLYVLGDAQEEAVLDAAGVREAKTLVATLQSDPQNVFVTLSAHQANPNIRIIARAQQASTQSKLRIAGATRVICPQIIGASRMAHVVLRPAVVDFVEMAHRGLDLELDQMQIAEGSPLVGKSLKELALPRRTGAHIVAVQRASGEAVYQPTPEMALAEGDTLVLVGKRGVAAAVAMLQPETGA